MYMEANTIKIRKMFYSCMKEKVWLEEKALEGWKLHNVKLGYIYEFEPIEPTRLVYEFERFDLSSHPSPGEIRQKEQFMDMAAETGWEILTCDEALTYYLCKPYNEHDTNELYNDIESRQLRAARFRTAFDDMGRSLLGYPLAINVIMFLLLAMEGFRVTETFTRVYLVFTLVYSTICFITQFLYKKLSDDMYAELCLSAEEWKKKFDYSRENVMKCRKVIVSSKALVRFLNKQAARGWYLSGVSMFSYTFTREAPEGQTTVYYAVDNSSSVRRRLKQSGLILERNPKDITNIGFEWLEQSIKTAQQEGMQYVCAFHKQFAIYSSPNPAAASAFQKKRIAVGWMSYSFVQFVLVCALLGGVVGFLAGMLSH